MSGYIHKSTEDVFIPDAFGAQLADELLSQSSMSVGILQGVVYLLNCLFVDLWICLFVDLLG
jgi:hypothetical protein